MKNWQRDRQHYRRMTRKILGSLICSLLLLLTGCSSTPQADANGEKWRSDWIKIGGNIGINAPKQFTLLNNEETLAADGLYYATWGLGDSIPYENSDGDTIDLYDVQLYFLASETPNKEAAQKNYDAWLSAAKESYEIKEEASITCNGQAYTMISYHCAGKDNPYDHGVSAFGVHGNNAVCVELTCVENGAENLEALLTEFLNGCHYRKRG